MSDKIRVLCAWCSKVIRDGYLQDGQASHGICPECADVVITKLWMPMKNWQL